MTYIESITQEQNTKKRCFCTSNEALCTRHEINQIFTVTRRFGAQQNNNKMDSLPSLFLFLGYNKACGESLVFLVRVMFNACHRGRSLLYQREREKKLTLWCKNKVWIVAHGIQLAMGGGRVGLGGRGMGRRRPVWGVHTFINSIYVTEFLLYLAAAQCIPFQAELLLLSPRHVLVFLIHKVFCRSKFCWARSLSPPVRSSCYVACIQDKTNW